MRRDCRVANLYELLIRDFSPNAHLLARSIEASFRRRLNRPRRRFDGIAKQVSPESLKRLILEFQHHSPPPRIRGKQSHGFATSISLFNEQRPHLILFFRAASLEDDRSAGFDVTYDF